MKRIIAFTMLVLMAVSVNAQAKAKRLKSYLSTTTYCAPGVSPYVENAIAFDSRTAVYKEFEPGRFKSTIEIQTIFRQGDKICTYSKIALDSPVVSDTANLAGAFIDQQRFTLPNGEYEIHQLDLTDANLLNSPYYYMHQRDILYVEPNSVQAQNAKVSQTTRLWVRGASIVISLGSLLYRVLE